jgi:hypothetical protein
MANTVVEVLGLPTSLSGPLVKLFTRNSDTLLNTGGDTLTERTNKKGAYTATVTEAIAGYVDAIVTLSDGTTPIFSGVIPNIVDDTGTYRVVDDGMPLTGLTGTASANVLQWSSTNVGAPDTAGYPVVTVKDGIGQGEILTDSGAISIVTIAAQVNLINVDGIIATSFAAGAINSTAIAANAIGSSEIADGAITAAKIADNAIDTATFAAGTTLPRVTLVDTVTELTEAIGGGGGGDATAANQSIIIKLLQARLEK